MGAGKPELRATVAPWGWRSWTWKSRSPAARAAFRNTRPTRVYGRTSGRGRTLPGEGAGDQDPHDVVRPLADPISGASRQSSRLLAGAPRLVRSREQLARLGRAAPVDHEGPRELDDDLAALVDPAAAHGHDADVRVRA